MRKKILAISILVISLVSSGVAQKTKVSDKLIDHIVGTWKISEIMDVRQAKAIKSKIDTAKTNKKNGLNQLTFKRDGRYKTIDSQKAIDSGSYRLNENHHRLYLESDADHSHPHEWDITISQNTLRLQPDSTKLDNHFRYVYKSTEALKP
jgi:hypothetical protein